MPNYVVLDKRTHKDLKISPLKSLKFACDLDFVPILMSEVVPVADILPIVFTDEKVPKVVALVSMNGQNLTINDEGKYLEKYVPIFFKSYPFLLLPLADNADGRVVCIDESAENLNEIEGKELFTLNGDETDTLKAIKDFLFQYEELKMQTNAIVQEIVASGILDVRELTIGEGNEKKVLVKNFRVVNKEKLYQLEDKKLASWVRRGIISFIDIHIASLSKVEDLFQKANI